MKNQTPLFLLIGLFLVGMLILDALPEHSVPQTEPIPTEASVPETTVPEPVIPETTVPPTTEPETEAPTEPQGTLEFNTYDITFRIPGDSWEVYSGTLDKEYVTFSSDNPEVVRFENGIVTAVGPGTAAVSASFREETISCIIRNVFTAEDVRRMPQLSAPECSEEPSDFFDDAVFVGDSVSLKLSYYAAATGTLGDAQFLVRGSYSVFHAVNNTMLMTYRGQELPLVDAIAATGANKIFFMLGMNDIAAYGISQTMDNWAVLIARVREAVPDAEIYIQSMTPVYTGGEKGSLNNTNTDAYNETLHTFAEANNCGFIDVAPYMKDAIGGLASRYCSDNYVHLTDSGANTWVKVLKTFAETEQ